jgi:hypothetical protein
MPPRLESGSVDILDEARYREVVGTARRFVLRLPFQYLVRNFGSEQVMA